MAIDIIGVDGSPEWDAACEFSDMLSEVFRLPDTVTLVAGAKFWGQGKVDVDIVALGSMAKGFVIDQKALPAEFRDRPAYLASFALTVEVKDLPPERLQIAVITRCSGNTGEPGLIYLSSHSSRSTQRRGSWRVWVWKVHSGIRSSGFGTSPRPSSRQVRTTC